MRERAPYHFYFVDKLFAGSVAKPRFPPVLPTLHCGWRGVRVVGGPCRRLLIAQGSIWRAHQVRMGSGLGGIKE